MEREANSIIKLKTVYVTKLLQKINFQFRHPENAKSIIGIMVNCNLYYDKRFNGVGKQVGTMALSNSQKGDVFYSQVAQFDDNDYRQTLERVIYPTIVKRNLSQWGKQFTWFKTNIPIQHAMMDCYYEDTISVQYKNDFGELIETLPYEVILYIQYELK
jgi:hypothetical protein